MAVDRRTMLLAVGAVAVAVAVVIWYRSGGPATPMTSAPPPRAPAGRADPTQADTGPGQVNLDALKANRDEPIEARRNPFRFQQPKPVAPAAPTGPPRPVNEGIFQPTAPVVPTGPPPPPPITLKFIGIVTQGAKRLAVLSDGKSSPVSGQEGDIILGQYRILKIGTESIEMAYVDGRGRQTIRLTGQ